MLYEKGKCYPKNKGFNYKLYFNMPYWTIEVYKSKEMIGNKIFHMTFEPRCGIDILDSNIIDTFISKTIKNL